MLTFPLFAVCLLCTVAVAVPSYPGLRCGFEDFCPWKWNTSDWTVTSQDALPANYTAGPAADAANNTHGRFLFLLVRSPGRKELHVWSPKYVNTGEYCRLELMVHMSNMERGNFKVVVETVSAANTTSWVLAEKSGNNHRRWEKHSFNVGRIRQEFNIIIEVAPSDRYPSHTALDNIKLQDCFPEKKVNECSPMQFRCSDVQCIDHTQVCDMAVDCQDGSDETQDCDKVPIEGTQCNFEDGLCGWTNHPDNKMNWTLHSGPTPTDYTGPSNDHTYKNSTGKYVYVEMSGPSQSLGAFAILESPIFNHPPPITSNTSSRHYNSCFVTFYYHQYGPHSGSIALMLTETHQAINRNQTTELWRMFGDQGDIWRRVLVILPHITQRYILFFEAKRSFSAKGDIALDDFAMSPMCFGVGNFTKEELNGYNYSTAGGVFEPPDAAVTHPAFVNETFYVFSTCDAKGMSGPKPEQCSQSYRKTNVNVTVLTEKQYAGIQKWTVPQDGFYTIIAKGASGGLGTGQVGSSRGAVARLVVELYKGQKLYILVGQRGSNAGRKNDSMETKSKYKHTLILIKEIPVLGGGGGGGGASYIFMQSKTKERIPLVVGAGGGGLAHGPFTDDGSQHGHGHNKSVRNQTGDAFGTYPAGAGGGWLSGNYTFRDITGLALVQGATGGKSCYNGQGHGGFGGGGGGCTAGGGGGGFGGGRAWAEKSRNGEGGYSWIDPSGLMGNTIPAEHTGNGEVYIIPAIEGCGCDYRCLALDPERSNVRCVCPTGWFLANNSRSCKIQEEGEPHISTYIIPLVAIVLVLSIVIGSLFVFLYNRYQQVNASKLRRKVLNGPDFQLNRIRVASDSMMTEFNPNYEFGGGTYTIRDLKDIPREQLRLVKALGQGAFGEVYQGFYRHRAGDCVEQPVAVKTLPELSTNQAETDFLMEALIMSKFNHPNIVHFIGVCFDKHPRFIVIELLAGGDLKTFLRESRPKPDRPSPLVMKDLLQCAMDVAKGCKYMEENRFIHRDIAARNCLLTTKGPGRVVKIADFGMARDIYRADYYRKGGKAMLPIKWMPPEAFLDGIFTSKTDVWSFGVLLWEVMSLGYMPYTGCANREVMQLVTSGGRLEPPSNCPAPMYAIMTQCWHPNPEERPTFGTILERLGYCMQDPDVIKAPLPVFYRPPSTERDTTIMRPPSNDDCLQPDYLVPLAGGLTESISTQPLIDQSNNNIKQPLPYVNVAVSNDQGPFIVSAHTHDTEIPC